MRSIMTYEELYAAVSELRSKADYFFKQPTQEDLKGFESDIEKILNYLEKINRAQIIILLCEKDKDEKENVAKSDLIISQIEQYIKNTATVSKQAVALATSKPCINSLSSTPILTGKVTNKPLTSTSSCISSLAETSIFNTDTTPTEKIGAAPKCHRLVRTGNYQFSFASYRIDPDLVQHPDQPPPNKRARTSPPTESRLLSFNALIPPPNPNKPDEFVRPSISASNLLFLRRIKPYLDKALTQPATEPPNLNP